MQLAICATIDRPSPEPGCERAVGRAVEAVEHVRRVRRSATPTPRSSTSIERPRTSTSTGVSGGLNLHALSTRLCTARSIAATRTTTVARVRRTQRDRPSAAAPLAFDDRARRARRGRPARRGSSARASVARSTSSATRSPSSASSTCAASTSSARCVIVERVGARWSSSMFVRSAVSGVRSSWLASIDEPSLLRARRAERGEHRVEARGEPADLVAPLDLDVLVEILGLRDVLGRDGELLDRAHDAARDQPGEARPRPAVPAERDEQAGAGRASTARCSSRRCCARSAPRRRSGAATVRTR